MQILKYFQYFQYITGLHLPRTRWKNFLIQFIFLDFELHLFGEKLHYSIPIAFGHDVNISKREKNELNRRTVSVQCTVYRYEDIKIC